MTKEQVLEAMAEGADMSKAQADRALGALLDSIKKALKKGDSLTLSGFGTFKVSNRKARQGINPKTGAKLQIPARTVPKFTAGKGLKEAVR
ncbi:MAG: HU family DNA-binding protein [Candidatus Yanofskybacteria bacterium]|nr:HU family DNA-binding protein [Candidatus Yanofskybacteria bacterium]